MARRQSLLAGYRRSIDGLLAKGVLPIIDIEHHWGARIGIEALVSNMDACGVALTWLGPNEKNGSPSSLSESATFPERLVPTIIHGDGPRWHGHDLALVDDIVRDARSGQFFAMGEFESRHYVSNSNNRDIHMPTDSASFQGVFGVAEETGLPFLLHHEAEDALMPELETMLQRYPGARVVWCHVGRNRDPSTWHWAATAQGVEKLILRYPQLHFDILQAGSGSIFPPTGVSESVLYYQRNGSYSALRPQWRDLFNQYPERFLIGSDINTFRWNNYTTVIQRLRESILNSLTSTAAAKVAYQNAWRLMSQSEW